MKPLALALVAATTLTLGGCRFGNRVDRRDPNKDNGRVLGYFSGAPQLYEVCAVLENGSNDSEKRCREVFDFSLIPGELYMTDPALIVIDDPKTATMTIRRKNDLTRGIAAKLEEDTAFRWSLSGKPGPFWGGEEDGCFHGARSLGMGSFTPQEGMSPSVDDLPLAGTFEFTGEFSILMSETVAGACAPLMAEVKACYLNYTACPYVSESGKDQEQMSLHLDVRAYFKDAIDAGAIQSSELERYRGIVYRVVSQ